MMETNTTEKATTAMTPAAIRGGHPRVRRGATPQATSQIVRKRFIGPTALFVIASLAIGFALGAVWMRLRHRTKDTVFAVNGVAINTDTFLHRLDTTSGTEVIHKIIEEELLLGFVKQKGLTPTEAQVQARYAQETRDPNFAPMLALTRLTPEDVKRAIRVQLGKAALYGHDVQVTDKEIQAFYKANIDKKNPDAAYYTPEAIRIAVIVTPTEAAIRLALAKLNRGLPFATVARTDSRDDSRVNGGVLPPIRRGGGRVRKVPGLEKGIFGLKIGDTTGPKKLAGVWWIIKCVDKAPEKVTPFEQVKEDCREAARVAKGIPLNRRKIEAEFTKYKDSAVIQAFRPEYGTVVHLNRSKETQAP